MDCLLDGGSDQHLVFTGLQYNGQDLGKLAAAVHFSVNSQRKIIRMAGPLEVRLAPSGNAALSDEHVPLHDAVMLWHTDSRWAPG